MKELTLDYSTWRCGGDYDGENQLGEGETALENKEGFQCCLGQFSLQLSEDICSRDLLNEGEPSDLTVSVEGLSYFDDDTIRNTGLSKSAIDINDERDTTPKEKIILLKELFLKEGYIINVINLNN